MFRVLAAVEPSPTNPNISLLPPKPLAPGEMREGPTERVESSLHKNAVFAIVVDPNPRRKTAATWHVDRPEEIINLLSQFTA